MRTTLVSIASDTTPLDGAYYEPEAREVSAAALLFHGNCMNFYVGAPRFLPPALADLGIASLAFNRRGHDVLSTRDSRDLEGGAYQTTDQAVADNELAHAWMAERGHDHPIVIGHSYGGMLGVQHAADRADVSALVLLSAHAGGADIAQVVSRHGLWGADRLTEIEEQARGLVEAGRSQELLMLPGWWKAITAESALDYLSGVPDIVELAPQVSCPVLYLRGDQEPTDLYPTDAFAAACAGPCDVRVIEDCGHFYVGREDAVIAAVIGWLEGVVPTMRVR